MEQRVCRRCLLKELDGAYFQSVYEYIKSIPEEEKTDPAEYAGRLEQCRRCLLYTSSPCNKGNRRRVFWKNLPLSSSI